MPAISMFFGIIITIFYKDVGKHNTPHIHARYQGSKASISIETGDVLAGNFPPKQLRMVLAWIEIHKDELFADWELAMNGEEPFKISPLQ
jgi:hypothetical protein